MTNRYFGYSMMSDCESPLPPPEPRERKQKNRACDLCSLRKTKCDEVRPCHFCIKNGMACTDDRPRKKSGPKSLRKKTLDSIRKIRSGDTEDLTAVVECFSALDPTLLRAMVPFTVPLLTMCLGDMVSYLGDFSQPPEDDLRSRAKKLAILSFSLVLVEVVAKLQRVNGSLEHRAALPKGYLLANSLGLPENVETSQKSLSLVVQVHVTRAYAECNTRLHYGQLDRVVHYYLALTELHMFSYLMLKGRENNHKLVHLRCAITHCQLMELQGGGGLLDLERDDVGLLELRRTLFTVERLAFLFSDQVFRVTGVLLGSHFLYLPTTFLLDSDSDMMHVLDDHLFFVSVPPNPLTWQFQHPKLDILYSSVKLKLQELAQNDRQDAEIPIVHLLRLLVLFNVLVVTSEYDQSTVASELHRIVLQICPILGQPDDIFKLHIDNLALLPHLLGVLRACIVTSGEHNPYTLDLLEYSQLLSVYMNLNPNTEEMVEEPVLKSWFSRLVISHWNTPMNHETP